jgi:uncharacterized protein (DUF302 family)
LPEMPDNGMIHLSSPHTVMETLARLETIVQAKGLIILARIDHSDDAAKAGLKMQPTKLLIFGNAKSGTPLMIASPSVAIDLPLEALIWQDGRRQNLALVQQPQLFERAARHPGRSSAKHRRDRADLRRGRALGSVNCVSGLLQCSDGVRSFSKCFRCGVADGSIE